jgi:hypothetical protein
MADEAGDSSGLLGRARPEVAVAGGHMIVGLAGVHQLVELAPQRPPRRATRWINGLIDDVGRACRTFPIGWRRRPALCTTDGSIRASEL